MSAYVNLRMKKSVNSDMVVWRNEHGRDTRFHEQDPFYRNCGIRITHIIWRTGVSNKEGENRRELLLSQLQDGG